VSWCTPVIPAFGRLRQEDYEFKAGLGYIAISRAAELHRLCVKQKKGFWVLVKGVAEK
jgi:hypothetical protein